MLSSVTHFVFGLASIALLAPVSHARSFPRDFIIPSDLPVPWTYQGCYIDVGRTLTDGGYDDEIGMTAESCIAYCSAAGYHYAGTEYFHECFCGDTLAVGGVPANPGDCSTPCAGDPTEACGGGNRLTLFWDGQSPPTVNPGENGWSSIGCYSEGIDGRALVYQYLPADGSDIMSVDICTTACTDRGYAFAGLEYADECWCGNAIDNGGALVLDKTACGMVCSGNTSEYCGGPSQLEMYQLGAPIYTAISRTSTTSSSTTPSATPSPTPSSNSAFPNVGSYSYYGCQTEGSVTRALNAKTTAYDSMTLQSCAVDCAGYTYFGTEYGRECYCGNSFTTGSQSAPQAECTFPCAGNGAEICGAGLRLSVYSTAVAPVVVAGPSNPATVGNYHYYSCMTEGANARALQGYSTAYDTMTLESCAKDCAGFEYFGTEYSRECYCGNSFAPGAVAAPEAECQNTNFLCMGDDQEFCGGSRILSVYKLA
ncbi:WSC-domain-containing protein [Stipitochalara longipes BDJ]|nr:WSC-domain-containing protein [Stipitochalara longipes BDJ]